VTTNTDNRNIRPLGIMWV